MLQVRSLALKEFNYVAYCTLAKMPVICQEFYYPTGAGRPLSVTIALYYTRKLPVLNDGKNLNLKHIPIEKFNIIGFSNYDNNLSLLNHESCEALTLKRIPCYVV
jgi:hypothetical protein